MHNQTQGPQLASGRARKGRRQSDSGTYGLNQSHFLGDTINSVLFCCLLYHKTTRDSCRRPGGPRFRGSLEFTL